LSEPWYPVFTTRKRRFDGKKIKPGVNLLSEGRRERKGTTKIEEEGGIGVGTAGEMDSKKKDGLLQGGGKKNETLSEKGGYEIIGETGRKKKGGGLNQTIEPKHSPVIRFGMQ